MQQALGNAGFLPKASSAALPAHINSWPLARSMPQKPLPTGAGGGWAPLCRARGQVQAQKLERAKWARAVFSIE
jgi:hypothetical protein